MNILTRRPSSQITSKYNALPLLEYIDAIDLALNHLSAKYEAAEKDRIKKAISDLVAKQYVSIVLQ
ncbi:hypothetical protein O997_02490 [Anaplasma phagocytophilum str. MRK]|nr:hypothetical protein O997_02490 [Anaplasma phagocytophilum str. MRK]